MEKGRTTDAQVTHFKLKHKIPLMDLAKRPEVMLDDLFLETPLQTLNKLGFALSNADMKATFKQYDVINKLKMAASKNTTNFRF